MRYSSSTWVSLFVAVVAAGPALAQPVAPVLPPEFAAPGLVAAGDPVWSVARPRLSVGYNTGPGFGYQNGYTTLDAFWPVLGNGTNEIVFVDTRGLLSDNNLLWGNNVELGYRRYNPDLDRIFGIWTSWDLRNTPAATYNQVSGGFETYGRNFDAHANWYAPAGRQYTQTSLYFLNAPTLTGNNIFLPGVVNYEAALTGTDIEAGGPLPYLGQYGLRGYGGGYAFHANTYGTVGGAQARLLARINNNMDLNLQVRTDNAFGTTVAFGGALRWGGLRREYREPQRDSVYNRMCDSTERNVNVSVLNKSRGFRQIALNPATGQPIFIVYVNNQAAPGGDGSFERPLNTLALAPGVAGTNGFIALEPTGVTNPTIALLNGQHLLGTGVPNFIAASQGVFTLPAIGTGTPVISGAGNGITLANGNEVANLNIMGGGITNGIVGTGINNFNIHGVNIAAANSGILLTDTTGFGQITSTTAVGTVGVTVMQNNGALALGITNSAFDGNSDDGIDLTTSGTATLIAQIQGSSTSNTTGNNGINAVSSGDSTMSLTLVNHTSSNNACCGLGVVSQDNSRMTVSVLNSTLSNNATEGINALAADASQMPIVVAGSTISGNGQDGILVTFVDGGGMPAQTLTVTGSLISLNGGSGINALMSGGTSQSANISGNMFVGNSNNGITIVNVSAPTGTVTVANNLTSNNLAAGISLSNDGSGTSTTATFNYHVIGNRMVDDAANGLEVINVSAGSFTSLNLESNNSDPLAGDPYHLENTVAGSSLAAFAPPMAPASPTDPRSNIGLIVPVNTVTFLASPGP